jgi:hypothetical protein
MNLILERWIRIAVLILTGITIIVLPRFLPDIPLAGLGDSDKFGIQLVCFAVVCAVISLDLLSGAIQETRAVLRGEASKLSYLAGAAFVVIVLALFVQQVRYNGSMVIESVVTIYVLAVGYLIVRGFACFVR